MNVGERRGTRNYNIEGSLSKLLNEHVVGYSCAKSFRVSDNVSLKEIGWNWLEEARVERLELL